MEINTQVEIKILYKLFLNTFTNLIHQNLSEFRCDNI